VWTFWRACALENCFGLFPARNILDIAEILHELTTVELQCMLLNDESPKT